MQLFPGELDDLLLILMSFSVGTGIGFAIIFVAFRNWHTKPDSTVLFQLKHPVLYFSLNYVFLFFLLALTRDLGYLPGRPHSVAYAYLLPLAIALPIVIASLLRARRAA